MPQIGVIIVAGGSGRRMGAAVPKQFLPLDGKPVLAYTLERFRAALPDGLIVVALPENEIPRWDGIAKKYGLTGSHTVCAGGATRFESVRKALAAIGPCDLIAVHDGVRPLVTGELIHRVIATASEHGIAIPALRPEDSFREIEPDGSSTPIDRSRLRAIQTPQVFRYDLLAQAYETEYDPRFTDDGSVVENSGIKIVLCEGDPTNIKITTPFHIRLAEALLKLQNG